MDRRSSDNRKPPDILAYARFRQALAELLTGSDYAEMTSGNRWDYAVEVYVLRRFGLSDNDLRVLVQKQFVEHAHETTTAESSERTFRPDKGVSFTKRTCFVLTPLGIAKAHSLSCQKAEFDPVQARRTILTTDCGVPSWDATRRVLSYGGQTVKQFGRQAVNQELVLSAFEDEGWPPWILDPLAPHPAQVIKRRLGETIKSLNRGHANPLIHFQGDGTGEGIQWQPRVGAPILRLPRLRMR
jgi:hypothetical protein